MGYKYTINHRTILEWVSIFIKVLIVIMYTIDYGLIHKWASVFTHNTMGF